MVETMSEKLIYAHDVIEFYGSLGFDLNQTNIVTNGSSAII